MGRIFRPQERRAVRSSRKSMLNPLSMLPVILVTATAVAGCESSADDVWDSFLADSSVEAFKRFSSHIDASECGWGNPKNTEIAPEQVREPLRKLIESGSDGAFLAGLSIIRCFDGGELEDFYLSGGRYLDLHPELFLSIVTDQGVELRDVEAMATAIGNVDHLEARALAVATRIRLLSEVADERSSTARESSLRALKALEFDLNRMESDLRDGRG